MAASDIRAGAAFVEFYADSKKLTAGLTAASNKIKAWSTSAKASIGGFGKAINASLTGFGSQLKGMGQWGIVRAGAIGGGLLAASKQFADAQRACAAGTQALALAGRVNPFVWVAGAAIALYSLVHWLEIAKTKQAKLKGQYCGAF